jgi:Cu/Ag efflux protein CusF
MLLWGASVACAITLGACAVPTDTTNEKTGSAQSADTATTYVGVLKSVDLKTGWVTIESNGNTVTLQHTALTVHVGVVPGPMHQRGVVPGPMRALLLAWDNEVARGATEYAFLVLLERFAWASTTAELTTTDGVTIDSVQPLP